MLKKMYYMVTPWAISTKTQLVKNRILGRITNYIYPFYCKINPIKKYKIITINKNIIISLTSFPERINIVSYCINSLLRQNMRANRIILWLAIEQFPNRLLDLPKKLINLCKYGLEIRFCDDLRSYKKIFYTGQLFSSSIIVTADDDTLYPEDWLFNLYNTHLNFNNCIVCYRAHEISFKDTIVEPYKEWNSLSKNIQGPSMKLIPIGVGGVLYPAHFFEEIEFDYEVIKRYSPTTDDIWLKILEIKKKVPVIKVYLNSKEWFTIRKSQVYSLKKINVEDSNHNDSALKLLMDYYKIETSELMSNIEDC